MTGATGSCAIVRDEVRYALPLRAVGELAHRLFAVDELRGPRQ
jgi:hypothetical protein